MCLIKNKYVILKIPASYEFVSLLYLNRFREFLYTLANIGLKVICLRLRLTLINTISNLRPACA